MFDLKLDADGTIRLIGRLDASHADRAREALSGAGPSCVVDLTGLEYISSAGLSALLEAQRRLVDAGSGLILRHPTNHIFDLLKVAGLDAVFDIER